MDTPPPLLAPQTVLYEDNHCLAVAKPAPLLTQGVPPGIPTLEAMVKAYLKERYHKPGNVYLGIPHRLDRPVSGVVLFARNTKAARRLAEQFQNRQVRKIYWAIVEPSLGGELPPAEGVWEDWLLKVKEQARSECATAETPERGGPCCAICDCDTTATERCWKSSRRLGECIRFAYRQPAVVGRCAATCCTDRACPLVLRPNFRATASSPCTRSLTFLHPIRYEPLTVTAPLPETWAGS